MKSSVVIVFSILLAYLVNYSNALGTMAIDLGNEFIKVAIVKSGVPMEIALNKESQRKTPAIISFRNDERRFGSSAESISVKYPADAFHYIPSLIGKRPDHISVQQFKERFPFYTIDFDKDTSQLVFKHADKIVFSVEELMAMLLQNAKEIAEIHADEPIKSAVITVPSYFGQAERRAILRSADLVNLDVHQLINENTAVALHFGVFRSKSINSTAQIYMFFNMGSQSSSITIASYVKTDQKTVDNSPQVNILGTIADSTLGITEFAIRLRDHLANSFKKQHQLDISKNNRGMMKLFKEAKRVVNILSANQETFAQVEYLIEEKDFKLKVTRSELETMCGDLFTRIGSLYAESVRIANVPTDDIKEIILMGGGSRVPKVQETLLAVSGKSELGRSINSDEAAALGAVYQAAFHSPGFRVKQFVVKDFNCYPIKVSYKSPISENDSEDKDVMLYHRGNPFPQKRGLSITKGSSDMDIYVNYGGLEENYSRHLFPIASSSSNLSVVHLVNVSRAIEKSLADGSRMKGFKVHFDIDYSGILTVSRVEARLERNSSSENKTTFESIGNTLSGMFGSNDENEKPDPKNDTIPTPTNSSVTSSTPKIISIPIDFTVEYLDAETPSKEVMSASREKLREIRENEERLIALEKSKNDLESYIFAIGNKIEDDPFKQFSQHADRHKISEAINHASEWYETQGADTTKEKYDEKLNSIVDLVKPVEKRMSEHKERPLILKNFEQTINAADEFNKLAKGFVNEPSALKFFENLTSAFGVFPYDEHMKDLDLIVSEHVSKTFGKEEEAIFDKLIEEKKNWLEETKKLFEELPKHKDATIKISDITEKKDNLIRRTALYKEKLATSERAMRIEISRWIRGKKDELQKDQEKMNSTEAKDPKIEEETPEEMTTTAPHTEL